MSKDKCFVCPGCAWVTEVSSHTGNVVCPFCRTKTERKDALHDCMHKISPNVPRGTVGTHIHNILTSSPFSWLVPETEGCGCGEIAESLNRNGNDWCDVNRELILNLLEQRAKKLEYPFERHVAKHVVVNRAIRKARRDERKTSFELASPSEKS